MNTVVYCDGCFQVVFIKILDFELYNMMQRKKCSIVGAGQYSVAPHTVKSDDRRLLDDENVSLTWLHNLHSWVYLCSTVSL